MNLQNKLLVITLLTLSGNLFAAEEEDKSQLDTISDYRKPEEKSDTKKAPKTLPLTKESFKQLNITPPEEDDSSDDCFSFVPSLQHASDCSTCSEIPHTQIEESSTNKS